MSESGSEAGRHPGGTVRRAFLPAAVFLLVVAMAITVAGVPVPVLFRPGTWLILMALLGVVAGGIARVVPGADVA